jgi:hypothetical protein
MKRIGYIFLLSLIWIICGSRSCGDGESLKEQWEKKHLIASRDSIKQAFEIDIPNDQLLKAFEVKAIQKLSDFADYLKIASDSSLDATFRQQAALMAAKLFIPGEINTRKWGKIYDENDLTTLDKLLNESQKQGMHCWVQPIQIVTITPLTRENDSTFKGMLSFYQRCILFSKPGSSEIKSGKLLIDMYAVKRIKPFGNEKLCIWEVYLGDMN